MAIVQLTDIPPMLDIYSRAVGRTLGLYGTDSDTAPTTSFRLDNFQVDLDHVASYCQSTSLRFGDTLPMTYPFVLTFPIVMKLMGLPEFPFATIGSLHLENVIEQYSEIPVSAVLNLSVWSENVRETRKGLLIDAISEVRVGQHLVWRQVSTFLHQQQTSLSGSPKSSAKPEEIPQQPKRVTRVTPSMIKQYASISGDHNPIHVSKLGAKAFGFPTTIAHGMWTAATMLASLEGRHSGQQVYRVKFVKPMMLPARVAFSESEVENGWNLWAWNERKNYPYLTATLRKL